MGAQLIAALIPLMPEIIEMGKAAFAKENPGVPPPTSEQVIAAWLQAATSTLIKDDLWLAAHPE